MSELLIKGTLLSRALFIPFVQVLSKMCTREKEEVTMASVTMASKGLITANNIVWEQSKTSMPVMVQISRHTVNVRRQLRMCGQTP